jgi:hypothetical protein
MIARVLLLSSTSSTFNDLGDRGGDAAGNRPTGDDGKEVDTAETATEAVTARSVTPSVASRSNCAYAICKREQSNITDP